LSVPSQPAKAQAVAGTDGCEPVGTGTLEVITLSSKVFGNTRNLRVWLPPEYGSPANTQKSYPVLYLLDGQMLFGRCAAANSSRQEWHVDEALTQLIDKNAVEPIIVVGIDNTGPKRDHEFGAYSNPLSLPDDDPGRAGDRFPSFLES